MRSLIDILTLAFTEIITTKFSLDLKADVTLSNAAHFGDYQCNSAMKCAKLLGKSPRELAQKIIEEVRIHLPMVKKMEVAGPGFINIWIDPLYIEEALYEMLIDPRLGIPYPLEIKKIIVEFSSPNTAKEMHVGHLRSTIIGECLARLFEFQGHNVLRLNHIGDWGTAFGMLIAYIKEYHPSIFSGKESTDLSSLATWYKQSKLLFDENPEFKRRAQLEVVELQGGNASSLHAWQIICAISRKAYQEIYDLLDVTIIERGESFYNPMLPLMIEELMERGMIEISHGAKCIFLEGFKNREGEPLPYMVQKSDGGYNYDTTDLAAIKQRVEEERADKIIYVVDMGQSTHFQMLFKAAEKVGYLNSSKTEAIHVPFGLVLGADGKKFKTRSGETEKLIDLIFTAITQAETILKTRESDFTQEEVQEVAKILGINAIKYADLSCQRTHDYQFSYERMLRFEGNTAAFLMYAYVRVAGIKRKSAFSLEALIENERVSLKHETELDLGIHLLRFQEVVEEVSVDLFPHRLTEYLFNLAEKFHAFFRDCKVVADPHEKSRLLLAEAAARVLKKGMELLGLKTVEKM